ncbi:hypothetical protein BDV95DRAFT_206224 [Massariosphaeria phaeospora]|uniref:Uncharacterized protein n=1 Tax=Massariosphaeria phaeospora TaxID=100035 RepID=A0A7C8I3T6_9PLEO|nr:hypothetical protein BDV95DRAFT_206224 [Massariosphaeria phaeospora]
MAPAQWTASSNDNQTAGYSPSPNARQIAPSKRRASSPTGGDNSRNKRVAPPTEPKGPIKSFEAHYHEPGLSTWCPAPFRITTMKPQDVARVDRFQRDWEVPGSSRNPAPPDRLVPMYLYAVNGPRENEIEVALGEHGGRAVVVWREALGPRISAMLGEELRDMGVGCACLEDEEGKFRVECWIQ